MTNSGLQTFVVSIIMVCVESETAKQIEDVVDHLPWAPNYERMENYITASSRPQWSASVRNADARIVIVDFDQDAASAMATVEALQQLFSGKLLIVALSAEADPKLILGAMRAGCSEYLDKPINSSQVAEALSRFGRRSTAAAHESRIPGRILSLFGAKGGVGTTTLSVHLAMYLVRSHQKKTLLIDNHSELGHVCLYMGLEEKQYSFEELIRNVNRLDEDLLKGFVLHHPSGLDVLASPDATGGARNIDPDALERTLHFLRGEYDYIVLDCAASFQQTTLAVFDSSDLIYLITTPEIGAIRNLSRYVDGLKQDAQTAAKLRVVMNRCLSKEAMGAEQVEKAIRLPLSVLIQNSYPELVRANNAGVPILPDSRSHFSAPMREWATSVVGDPPLDIKAAAKKGFAFWK